MSFTARDIITQAQKDCGVLGSGQTMNAEDTNDALIRLQNMMAQWQKKRWLVPSLFDVSAPGNNAVSNKIGNGQYWNTPRPDKIRAGYFIQLNGNNQVSFPLWPMFSYEDYTRISLKQLNSFPTRYFYDGAFPYGNVFIWPIPSPSYEIHLIIPSQLGFSTTIESGTVINQGAGYTNGAYVAVPLIYDNSNSSNGISATANMTVTGGIVTTFELQNGGEFYQVNDLLAVSNTFLGGTGAGFNYRVDATQSNLDSIMELPPEYMEAMIYNLSIRLSAMYQIEATKDTKILARTSLKTIIAANTQIPQLLMPTTLLTNRRAGIVNADGGVVWSDVG